MKENPFRLKELQTSDLPIFETDRRVAYRAEVPDNPIWESNSMRLIRLSAIFGIYPPATSTEEFLYHIAVMGAETVQLFRDTMRETLEKIDYEHQVRGN
ncbi:MAG: hypothetical protein ACD_30C00010G0002 [uncultured bacterium]|uniref:Uncharacterized protein n=4 Tax=Candidatus Daviesiibacteriota TaxID=1752718 RepID=A0A0G0F2L7_9BACT|nr:MAG: hypothetical protein ACD_30C00010G0002 [uncultured bacterium]KKQ07850.1 MAG: hypothetical protein US19_C0036G0009 [Candidatus Daviesbacteria bacterium GW2011_GWB1_36_5]KKQ14982.1 MAG: hypothetical protein US28_C0025G0005 [Candidatus Daviesbacteria bacterium GW2011_GWA1_36_8]OGE16826.1 MAG: hypothetical protein A2858_02890 [Candidatus Daviesbacteria bacterium RIFCSPHIGHO2_01_FULL_36_37]OGE31185.1 MAG: hypothetical protein A3C99_00865 [Candidatus Daviesbacteria bacterium RIFCSPHIGHO2_02_F